VFGQGEVDGQDLGEEVAEVGVGVGQLPGNGVGTIFPMLVGMIVAEDRAGTIAELILTDQGPDDEVGAWLVRPFAVVIERIALPNRLPRGREEPDIR
jgi:hypothetical protein